MTSLTLQGEQPVKHLLHSLVWIKIRNRQEEYNLSNFYSDKSESESELFTGDTSLDKLSPGFHKLSQTKYSLRNSYLPSFIFLGIHLKRERVLKELIEPYFGILQLGFEPTTSHIRSGRSELSGQSRVRPRFSLLVIHNLVMFGTAFGRMKEYEKQFSQLAWNLVERGKNVAVSARLHCQ